MATCPRPALALVQVTVLPRALALQAALAHRSGPVREPALVPAAQRAQEPCRREAAVRLART
jgi:hypothetical protein